MNDQPTPHSGSRWEPPPTPPAAQTGSQPGDARAGAPAGNESPTGEAHPATSGAEVPRGRARPFAARGRGVKVAAATVIVTLGGLGGFALGQAASEGGDQIGLVGSNTDDGRFPGAPPDSRDGSGADFHDGDLDRVAPPHFDDDGPATPPDELDDNSDDDSYDDSDDDRGSDDTT